MKKILIIFGIILVILIGAGYFGWQVLSKQLNSMAADLDQKSALTEGCKGNAECIAILDTHYIDCGPQEKAADFKAFIMALSTTVECLSDKSGVDMNQYFTQE